MADVAPIDENSTKGLIAASSVDGKSPIKVYANPTTHRLLVDASGSSAPVGILVATGTVDDSNTAFTFVSLPQIIVVNGNSYRQNHGWSWNSGTLTATLDSAVGTGGDIYGIQ